MSGKGDKNRTKNLKEYWDNYEEIEWRAKSDFCFNCGRTFHPEDKRNYYEDGQAYCIKCRFM